MTIRECYEAANSNFDEVLARLGSERLIQKFALKFLDDTSYQELLDSMREADGEKAFRAAHTLKGVCLNLGFTALGQVSSVLTEALRPNKDTTGCEAMLADVTAEYDRLVAALRQLA